MQPGVCCCGIVDRWMMEPFNTHTDSTRLSCEDQSQWKGYEGREHWKGDKCDVGGFWNTNHLKVKSLKVFQGGKRKTKHCSYMSDITGCTLVGGCTRTQTRTHPHTRTHTPRLSSAVMQRLAHRVLPLVCVWVHTAVLHSKGEWNNGSDKKTNKKKTHTPHLPTHTHTKTDLREFLQSTTEAWEQSKDIEERQTVRQRENVQSNSSNHI